LEKPIKNIAVIGVGGVGGYFGGKLVRSLDDQNIDDKHVTFVARGKHGQCIKNIGILLKFPNENDDIICNPHKATDKFNEIEPADLILLCVKSYDLEEVVKKLDHAISDNTIIIPLLNGVDIYSRIRNITTKGIVLPSCVYIAAHISEPGVVSVSGPQGAIISGPDPMNKSFDPEILTRLFENTGFKFKWVDEPYSAIWEKYAYVASFAIITGYSGKSFIEVVNDEKLLSLLKQVMNEILALAKALNINFADGFFEKSVKRSAVLSPDARTSFSRDLEKGKRSEIDVFGYTIINKGKEIGIPTPVTERLVREIEKKVNLPMC
jgi:2-dehydropantoate 2-reductase